MRSRLALLAAAGLALSPVAGWAQNYNQHPGYLRALSDLRIAVRLLQHHGPFEPPQSHEEGEALNEIVFAGNNIKEVLAFDGDDPSVKVAPDMNWDDHAGRLRTAQEFLRRAHDDLFSEPDNPVSRELRGRAAGHIENASRWTAAAIQRWHF